MDCDCRLTKISQGSQIHLGISKDAACCSLVETIHNGVAIIGTEACEEECSFVFGKEFCCLWPISHPKLCDNTHYHGEKTFDYN
jgi:hypothetical protein